VFITLTNTGKQPGKITLKCENKVKVDPNQLNLAAGASA
jgi:hypothetical protein